ncbi:MAG: DMT family transporter [Chloroflexi bacterium]|nr:DMT family transporter [Chloroflexota bacterium]MCI0783871.1 DMT family transporter [Chloroflexota bacterium]MCI0814513.1 DMT family transporter [Chloroflexota bacterium]MCI0817968.1 DMT family transporter [Chloroflexota bacterium]MCI0832296.1 DMT family transporter [Chloroflexota bacterium]
MPTLFALGAIWGGSFLFIKVIVDETGPLEVVFGRVFFGCLAVGAYVLVTRHKMIVTPSLVARVSVLAILANIMPFALISWGEQHIDSGTASVLNAMVPIFTAVVAAIALDEEHFTPARLGGLLLGFVGVAVLTGTESLDVTDAAVAGQLAVVGAALCYGLGAVYMRSLLREQDAVSLTMLQLMLSVLIAGALLIVVSGAPSYSLSLEAWASLIALGTLGTGVGYVMFVWLIENIGSVRASLVTYIVPVLALFLGWLILDESIGVNTIAGFLLIIAGVATVMRGQTPSNQRQREPVAPAAVGE